MRRKALIIISIISVLVLTIFIYRLDRFRIQRRLDIRIPWSARVEYYQHQPALIDLGGVISIIQMDENGSEYVDEFIETITNNEDSELTLDEVESSVKHVLNTFQLEIPDEYAIDWAVNFVWAEHNGYVYVLYYPNEKLLYIIEVGW